MQRHFSPHLIVAACTTSNCQHRVGFIEEWPLYGDLSCREEYRPEALPGFPWNGTHTMSVVTANLVLVLFIEDGISEGENIPARVAWWSNINDRVRDGMLDNVNGRPATCMGKPPA